MENRLVTKFGRDQQELKKIVDFIYLAKGINLCSYRQNFIYRRLWSRMLATHVDSYSEYLNLLKNNPLELNKLLDTLSINVSDFFRNPEVFEEFKKIALPELIQRKEQSENRNIRAWSAGCACGQEAYSLAILISQELKGRQGFTVRIWGTDVDKDALEKAKKAAYERALLENVNKEILEKYFISSYNNFYKLKDDIRRMVNFEEHNLITDLPLKYMDIIFCRNMMIYLTRQQQEILFTKFYQSLRTQGYLVIGQVEAVWNKGLFKTVDLRKRIYQKPESQ